MKSTRIRPGLYQVATNGSTYSVEDLFDGQRWVWRVTDQEKFFDGWVDDFPTKKVALEMLERI